MKVAIAILAISITSIPAEAKMRKLHDASGNPIVVSDARPARWCGWWLRQELNVADKAFNRAIAWARYGSKANGPSAGVIAVWPHHVGIITAVPGPGRIILKSGNDGHAVRERERSTKGIIAYRFPSGSRVAVASVYETTSGALR